MTKKLSVVLLALALLFMPVLTDASTASNTVTVPLSLQIPESVTLTAPGSIVLSNSTTSGSVTATVAYQIQSGHTAGVLYAWLSGFSAIAYVNFSTQFNSGTAVACNQGTFPPITTGAPPVGISGQDCGSFAVPNVGTILNASVPINVTLSVSPSIFGSVPVGSYNGTLNLLVEIS